MFNASARHDVHCRKITGTRNQEEPMMGKTMPLTPTTSPLKMERSAVAVPPDFSLLFFPPTHIVPHGGIKLICVFKNLLRLVITG